MVLFDNVYVGQRVEVLWNNGIYKGTVQFKGPIATRRGEWIGVALELPVGDSNGMLFARRYFQCPPNHGVFVRSDRLRFIPSIRCLFNRYHSVSRTSDVEEYLFETPYPEVNNGPYNPINISQKDIQRARTSLGDYSSESVWEKPKCYHLRHSVSNHIPAATMLRPGTTQVPFRYLSRPIHVDYWKDDDFERKPSIPKIHMPHSALKEQVRRGWQGAHYVRQMTVPTGRDKMKFSQWNDISP
ncbi:hypothetical protein BsWGS_03616 [Bradybaena similaris]